MAGYASVPDKAAALRLEYLIRQEPPARKMACLFRAFSRAAQVAAEFPSEY
jgi:hypothetical protein